MSEEEKRLRIQKLGERTSGRPDDGSDEVAGTIIARHMTAARQELTDTLGRAMVVSLGHFKIARVDDTGEPTEEPWSVMVVAPSDIEVARALAKQALDACRTIPGGPN